MSSTRWLAAGLGVSYTVGAGIFLVVEPTMGFRTFDDFWNPALVVPALTSYAWLVSDLCHLASGVLLVLLAASLGDATQKGSRLISVLALCAGTTFVLLAMLDRAAALLPARVTDASTLATLAIGFIATRVGVLFAGLFLLGGVIGATAVAYRNHLPRWFGILSLLVALAAMGFTLVPTPIPLLLAAWAYALSWVWRD